MYITINDIPYNVESHGAGQQQALFLHYFGGSASTWREVEAHLDGVRCVALDLCGFGATPPPSDGVGYTLDQHVIDLLALIEQLELNNFTLVGHSMGGKIAMALAAQNPPGLHALVLVAPSPATPRQLSAKEIKQTLDAYGDRAAIEQMIRKLSPLDLPANLFERAVAENLQTSEAAWKTWPVEEAESNIADRLAQITVPVHIIIGENDPIFSLAEMTSDITPYLTSTAARVRTEPAVGHLLPYEVPQAVAAVIQRAMGLDDAAA